MLWLLFLHQLKLTLDKSEACVHKVCNVCVAHEVCDVLYTKYSVSSRLPLICYACQSMDAPGPNLDDNCIMHLTKNKCERYLKGLPCTPHTHKTVLSPG